MRFSPSATVHTTGRPAVAGGGIAASPISSQLIDPPEVVGRKRHVLSRVARAITAVAVVVAADVHFVLWYHDGFSEIHAIGPLFLLDAIAGAALGVLVVVWEHWIPAFLATGFALATLAGFYLSVTVGIFGLHEVAGGGPQLHAEIAEWTAVFFGLLATFLLRPHAATRRLRAS